MDDTRIFIAEINGELTVFYAIRSVSADEVDRFINCVCKTQPADVFEEKQENLQYYCIDGRVWLDTEERVAQMRRIINS